MREPDGPSGTELDKPDKGDADDAACLADLPAVPPPNRCDDCTGVEQNNMIAWHGDATHLPEQISSCNAKLDTCGRGDQFRVSGR